MITNGNATLYVSDLDAAVDFYTKALGLKLRMRAGPHWAEVEAGKDLVIGLHPQTPQSPRPGTPGAIQIGLSVDPPLEDVVATLSARGVRFDGPIIGDPKSGMRFVYWKDLDGNPGYLWEMSAATHEA